MGFIVVVGNVLNTLGDGLHSRLELSLTFFGLDSILGQHHIECNDLLSLIFTFGGLKQAKYQE